MNFQVFLIKHGEKLLLLLVVLLCSWYVFDGWTDPEAIAGEVTGRSKKSNPDAPIQADAIMLRLVGALEKPGRPKIMVPPNYLDLMQRRLQVEAKNKSVVQFIGDHPSYGKNTGEARRVPYVYEMGAAKIGAVAQLTRIQVKVILPTAQREAAMAGVSHITDQPSIDWEHDLREGRKVKNHAEWLGLLLEVREGGSDNPWRPFITPNAPAGYLPLSGRQSAGAEFDLELSKDVEAWQSYQFRTTLVVAATAWPRGGEEGAKGKPGSEVLVYDGPYTGSPLGPGNEPGETALKLQLRDKEGLLDGMAPVFVPPENVTFVLPEGQSAYASKPVLSNTVIAPSPVGFVLLRASTLANPKNARFLMMKMMPGGAFEKSEFTVDVGEAIGGPIVIKRKVGEIEVLDTVDMTTPIILKDVQDGITRLTHYEIEMQRRIGQTPESIFKVVPRTRSTYLVTLVNPKTNNAQMEVFKVDKIRIRKDDKRFAYPDFPVDAAGMYDEEAAFAVNPLEYKAPPLTPPAPIFRRPTDPVFKAWLEAQAQKAGHQIFNYPEAPVALLKDGRALYIDPLNKKIFELKLQMTDLEKGEWWKVQVKADNDALERAKLENKPELSPIGPEGEPLYKGEKVVVPDAVPGGDTP